MDPAEGFAGFVAVVDSGSVSAAARLLSMPRPTLSRQLARLEERLGVRLLHRSTRRLVPTQAGHELYLRARSVVDGAREALAAVERLDDVPRGVLRVAAPPGLTVLAEAFASFLHRWPEVRLEVSASTRHVDLVRENIDVALRAGLLRDPSLVVRRLSRSDTHLMASPSYLAAHGTPRTPADLVHHACLLGFEAGDRPETGWPLRGGGVVSVQGRVVTNDLELKWKLAVAGEGITLLPRIRAAEDLAEGRLVPVLEQEVGQETSIALVYVERAFLDPKIRVFVDHMAAAFEGWGWATALPGNV